MEHIQKVRWMQDVLPEDQLYITFIKKVLRHEFRKNWFKRISTPVLEQRELFENTIWEWTDIVDKEMYSLIDRKWRELVLKPEWTAWVMRSYIENDMQSHPQPVYLYYMEPHFRYDRPQKWRFRQFMQIWAEIIWEQDPIIDAELILICYQTLNKLWLQDKFTIKINSIWTAKDREKYIEELIWFYENKKHLLSDDALHKLETNPLRLLDTKIEDEIILADQAPKITSYLKKDSKNHYAKVKEYLDLLNIPYVEDHKLVRWLDYYTNTVFEFVNNSGNSQDSLLGWWRYDALATRIWSKDDIPAAGFALWVERLVNALKDNWIQIVDKDKVDLYFIQLWDEPKKIVLPLTLWAREAGINTLASLGTPSLKVQLKKANKLGARYVVIVGIMEASSGRFQVRDMEAGTQEEVNKDDLINYIIDKIWRDKLDFYSPERDLAVES